MTQTAIAERPPDNPYADTDSVVTQNLYNSFLSGMGADDLGMGRQQQGDFDRYFDLLGGIAKPTIVELSVNNQGH